MSVSVVMGSLADPEVQKSLAAAQEKPDRWTIYLVPENGQQRTKAQNRLYRAFLSQLVQTHGRTHKYWNQYLVERFLGYEEVLSEDGYIRRVLPSTSTLTVAEFSRYLSACMVWAAENNIG